MKKSDTATLNNTKVGDVVYFLYIPYFENDLRCSWVAKTVTSIVSTKSGKRFTVYFDNEDFSHLRTISVNTFFQEGSFIEKMIKDRGLK